MSTDPKNEKFTAFEMGLKTRSNDGSLAGSLNIYNTSWNDRLPPNVFKTRKAMMILFI